MSFTAIVLLSLLVAPVHSNDSLTESSTQTYIREYDIPTPASAPLAITADKEGKIWFTECNSTKLGVFDPNNESFSEYVIPGIGDMWGITVAESGQVWFTQYAARGSVSPGGEIVGGGHGRIVQFNPSNQSFSFVDVPTNGSVPMRITTDGQGRIWFTEFLGNKIGLYDPITQRLTEYAVPTEAAGVADLTFDKSGNLWFTEAYAKKVGKLDPRNGEIKEFVLGAETPSEIVTSPVGVGVDSGGVIWVADHGGNWVARFDPQTGHVLHFPTEFPPPAVYPISIPNGLLIDQKGRIWFSEHGDNSIGYIVPETKAMVEYPIPTGPISTALWIALAPDGNIWFAEWDTSKIGVVYASLPIPVALRASLTQLQINAGGTATVPLLTKVSENIEQNALLRYTWSSYDPNDVSVKFSSTQVTIAGMADVPITADLTMAQKVKPGDYLLGLGLDLGQVRVWTMIPTTVGTSTSQPQAQTPSLQLLVGTGVTAAIIAFGVGLLVVSRRKAQARRLVGQ